MRVTTHCVPMHKALLETAAESVLLKGRWRESYQGPTRFVHKELSYDLVGE